MDLANSGIGKALYRNGNYKEAMEYFKNAHDKEWYSKAYKEYRKEWIASAVPYVALILIAIFLFFTIKNYYIRIKRFLKGGKI
jgi:tetratricopeptide (TPR) repeat protein